LSDSNWHDLSDNCTIRINTKYPNAWHSFLNHSFNKDVKNNISISRASDIITIKEHEIKDIKIDLHYRKTSIFAKIEYGG